MNLSELKKAVAERAGLSQVETDRILKALFATMEEALKEGETVTLFGFGAFSPTQRAARIGRNPQTGVEVTIPASKGVRFKPGKGLKDAINGT